MHFFYSKSDPEASGSEMLREFGFINDFGFEEYKDIRQKPLSMHYNLGIEICYVSKGRYEWVVGDTSYILYPGDGFITCPWQKHGSPRNALDLGEIYWLVVKPDVFNKNGDFYPGSWSRLSVSENEIIGKAISGIHDHRLQKVQVLKTLFEALNRELHTKKFGYYLRICNIIEDFLIETVRIIESRKIQDIRNKNRFLEIKGIFTGDLSEKITLKDISFRTGIGITTLTRVVKEHTGYTPANYVIYLRIEKAKKMLRSTPESITKIALACGFYSAQHFSSSFSKWVGKTPNGYRKQFNFR